MSGVDKQTEPVIDQGEPTFRTIASTSLVLGALHAGAALLEDCLRKFHLLLALFHFLFAGWLLGWLRCRDQHRERVLLQTIEDRDREITELKRSTVRDPGTTI